MFAETERELAALVKAAPVARLFKVIEPMPFVEAEDLIKLFGANPPACYVSLGDARLVEARTFDIAGVLAITVRHAKGEKVARTGDGKVPGAYELARTVASLVHENHTKNAAYDVVGIDLLDHPDFRTAQLVVASVRFMARTELPPALDGEQVAALADFLHFHADYDIEPFSSPEDRAKWAAQNYQDATTQPDLQSDNDLPTGD